MVAKHLEKQQKEKETRAMERLHLLLPALGPTVRALALQKCYWDEERALTMLRRFQVAKVDDLSKLHKERRRHQLALQSGKLEKRHKQGSGSDGGSGSDSDSGSGSGSGGSSSSSEDERGKRKGGSKRRRSRSRSTERASKRDKKERREKDKSGSKDKKRRKDKRGKKEKKEKRSSKDKARAKQATRGAIGHEYGKYGLIRDTDMYSKRPEFQLWAMEVKKIDIEAMPRSEEKEMFKDYMEEYNTATLPHKKYYDLDMYEKQQAAKAARKGISAKEGAVERTAFDDEMERKREMAEERKRLAAERMQRAYNELRTTDKAKDMREQQMLRSQMELAYKTGDHKKAEKLAELLKPVELAEIGKTKRPPATGT